MSHVIKDAAKKVQCFREKATLLKRWHMLPPSDKLLQLAVAEVAEVREELEKPQVDQTKAADEFGDVFVFAVTHQLAHLPDLDIGDKLTSVNGSGKKSGALEVFEQTLLEVQDDPAALHQVMRQLVSLMVYNPAAYAGISQIEKTLTKVRGNRPPELYQVSEEMSDEDVIAKYRHLEQATRRLRKHFKTTLNPGLWQPYRSLLEDWQNSALSLSLLDQRLADTQPVARAIEPWYAQANELPIRHNSGLIYSAAQAH